MPAKTVEDLIAFNNSVPEKLKVKIMLTSLGEKRLEVAFVDSNGNHITQKDPRRAEYYGKSVGDKIEKGSEPGFLRYVDPDNKPTYPYGYVSCKANPAKDHFICHNAWFIGSAEAAKGYGPLLYDCLLAKLGERNLGLTPDRSLVSPLAAKVWVEYLTNRPDVRKEPLDFNNSTPQREDDCFANYEEDKDWNAWLKEPEMEVPKDKEDYKKKKEEHEKKKENYRLMGVAVKWAYFDDGIETLKKLRDAGLIVESVSESYNSYKTTKQLISLYHSFLNEVKG